MYTWQGYFIGLFNLCSPQNNTTEDETGVQASLYSGSAVAQICIQPEEKAFYFKV